ncbi:HemK family protein methyltransferase [Candidatus Gracilibacteria bacterium]|nr:HemK family protein methyltransferase [Candidatus Gracilibacteria bacterium]
MSHSDYPEDYKKGCVTFFGREFMITPDVLIPRLETECLVRRARTVLKSHEMPTLVDIGTGSGIIGVSCADLVEKSIFLDISPQALQVAKSNFFRFYMGKDGVFQVSDLLLSLPDGVKNDTSQILFLANLPYIKGEDWLNMSPDTRFEPEIALFGGTETGFELYERLFEQMLVFEGRGFLIIEFGFDQRQIAEDRIKKYGWKHSFFADYAGIERFCEITL